MSVYVLSDVHGEYKRFCQLMALLKPTEHDRLFILGDLIDRGYDGLKLLLAVRDMPNVTVLLGNHEAMLLDAFGEEGTLPARNLWIGNGGAQTCRDFLKLPEREQAAVIQWLYSWPDQAEVSVNGRDFYLVHGAPGVDAYSRLWGRVEPDVDYTPLTAGHTVIFGHTPVWHYHTGKPIDHFRMWHGENCICLDCGCGHISFDQRRLACLRLDDMAEFYV